MMKQSDIEFAALARKANLLHPTRSPSTIVLENVQRKQRVRSF
jgi:hypothetical protein